MATGPLENSLDMEMPDVPLLLNRITALKAAMKAATASLKSASKSVHKDRAVITAMRILSEAMNG